MHKTAEREKEKPTHIIHFDHTNPDPITAGRAGKTDIKRKKQRRKERRG